MKDSETYLLFELGLEKYSHSNNYDVEQDRYHTPRQFLDTATGAYGAQDYDYDAVGNRSSFEVVHNAILTLDTYSYPASSNRLSQVAEGGGHTRTFSYDAAGNTTYDQRTALDGYGYTYNAANRMDTITKNGVVQAEYKYNALGQQVVRQLNGQGITIHAVYDLDGNRIAEYNAQTSTLLAEYIWISGQPIAAISGGVTYFVRSDHIGRPAFATDGTGAIVWDATYKPFGEVDASTGAPINLRFPGQWFSAESDLNQNWMRDYDPTLGRYIQADPLGLVDGASVYGYALQSPNKYIDPRGEYVFLIPIAIGAAVGAVVGYIETGCWQGAVGGGIIGGLAGVTGAALGPSSVVAGGAAIGAGASALSQILNNGLAGQCGCAGERRKLSELVLSPEFGLNTTLGAAGGAFGGLVGSSSSIVSGWAGAHVGKSFVKGLITEGVSLIPGSAPELLGGSGQ